MLYLFSVLSLLHRQTSQGWYTFGITWLSGNPNFLLVTLCFSARGTSITYQFLLSISFRYSNCLIMAFLVVVYIICDFFLVVELLQEPPLTIHSNKWLSNSSYELNSALFIPFSIQCSHSLCSHCKQINTTEYTGSSQAALSTTQTFSFTSSWGI